jgi:zinc/manganese transport system permease protein
MQPLFPDSGKTFAHNGLGLPTGVPHFAGERPVSFFAQSSFLHALVAGSAIGLAAGLVGYFVVLRAQVFTGDALGHVAFTGALAALAAGIDLRIGLFALTIAVGLFMGALGHKGRTDDALIGSVFAWILGLGVLFLSLYTTSRSSTTGGTSVAVLFGSILGLSSRQAAIAAGGSMGVTLLLLSIARPLLFASVDEAVASARGVPVRALGIGFLGLVGAASALSAQAVGALLLLGLLSAPAGTAHRLTGRPYLGLVLSGLLAVVEIWIGLILSRTVANVPPSFAILGIAAAVYFLVLTGSRWRGRSRGVAAPGSARAWPH